MCAMTIWILAIVLMVSAALAGWRQGAIRAGISFVGILFAWLLAGLIGKLIHPVLTHLGASNPIIAWAIAPIVGFILISAAFKIAAQPIHHRIEHFYRYKAGDLRLALWQRMNTRLGICLGLLNGALYFILVSFLIFNLSYWTTQVCTGSKQSFLVRWTNSLGADLQSNGLDKMACGVASMPPMFYKLADLSGMLCQNPQVGKRFADYPGLISLWQREDMQPLVQDSTVTSAASSGTPIGQVLDDPNVRAFLKNKELVQLASGILKTNMSDLMEYLKTGQSKKYGDIKILGRWNFNPAVTFAWMRQEQPKMSVNEARAIRGWLFTAYKGTHVLVAGDHQVYFKHLPHPKVNPGPPPTTTAVYEDWKGDWSANGTNYDLHVKLNGKDRFMTASATDLRLTVHEGKSLMIFDRAN